MDVIIGAGLFIIKHGPELIGFILPPFVEWLNREVPTGTERFIVTLLVCLIVSIILKWDNIVYGTPEQVAATFGILFVQSQLIFRLYFKNSWLKQKINEIGDNSI